MCKYMYVYMPVCGVCAGGQRVLCSVILCHIPLRQGLPLNLEPECSNDSPVSVPKQVTAVHVDTSCFSTCALGIWTQVLMLLPMESYPQSSCWLLISYLILMETDWMRTFMGYASLSRDLGVTPKLWEIWPHPATWHLTLNILEVITQPAPFQGGSRWGRVWGPRAHPRVAGMGRGHW